MKKSPVYFIGKQFIKKYSNVPEDIELVKELWKMYHPHTDESDFYSLLSRTRLALDEGESIADDELDRKALRKASVKIEKEFNQAFYEGRIQLKGFTQEYAYTSKISPAKYAIKSLLEDVAILSIDDKEKHILRKLFLEGTYLFTDTYSLIIEEILRQIGRSVQVFVNNDGFYEEEDSGIILYKINGTIAKPNSIYFSAKEDSQAQLKNELVYSKINQLAAERALILLGFPQKEPFVVELLAKVESKNHSIIIVDFDIQKGISNLLYFDDKQIAEQTKVLLQLHQLLNNRTIGVQRKVKTASFENQKDSLKPSSYQESNESQQAFIPKQEQPATTDSVEPAYKTRSERHQAKKLQLEQSEKSHMNKKRATKSVKSDQRQEKPALSEALVEVNEAETPVDAPQVVMVNQHEVEKDQHEDMGSIETQSIASLEPRSVKFKETKKPKKKFGLAAIFAIIACLVIGFRVFFSLGVVDGTSMLPTLHADDHVLVDKKADFTRFSIVSFVSPDDSDETFIKRIIGLPGDKIEVKKGKLYINDELEEEAYLSEEGSTEDFTLKELTGVERVPENKIFVLGDNRTHSRDSRNFGFIDMSKVQGEVNFILWPFKNIENK